MDVSKEKFTKFLRAKRKQISRKEIKLVQVFQCSVAAMKTSFVKQEQGNRMKAV